MPAIPYIVCFFVLRKATNPVLVLPAVVIAIVMDVVMYVDLMIYSTSSTAALGLIMAPFVNLIISLPVGFLLGGLLMRFGPPKAKNF